MKRIDTGLYVFRHNDEYVILSHDHDWDDDEGLTDHRGQLLWFVGFVSREKFMAEVKAIDERFKSAKSTAAIEDINLDWTGWLEGQTDQDHGGFKTRREAEQYALKRLEGDEQ